MKPIVHAENNVKKWGGRVEDYLPIHQFMDSSKGAMCDVRHRVLTHTSWFIQPDGILELVFGIVITNSDGVDIPVRDIGEQHIIEDFDGFIPTPQDFLRHMEVKPWMHRAGGTPYDDVVSVPSSQNVEMTINIDTEKLTETLEEKVRDIVEEVFGKEKKVPPIFPDVPYDPTPHSPNPFKHPYYRDLVVRDQVELIPYCKSESISIQNHDKEHFVCFSNNDLPSPQKHLPIGLDKDTLQCPSITGLEPGSKENAEAFEALYHRPRLAEVFCSNMKLNVSC